MIPGGARKTREGLQGAGARAICAIARRERQGVSEQLTGRHVLAWLGAFFGVMFIANIALIYFALHTLHGSELENPYDASQAFNKRIADARAQDAARLEGRRVDPGRGLRRARHGRVPRPRRRADLRSRTSRRASSIRSTRRRTAQTTLASDGVDYEGIATPVAPGRWTLVIEASRGAERLFRSENKLAVTDTAPN